MNAHNKTKSILLLLLQGDNPLFFRSFERNVLCKHFMYLNTFPVLWKAFFLSSDDMKVVTKK